MTMSEIRSKLDYVDRLVIMKMTFARHTYGDAGLAWLVPFVESIRSELLFLDMDPDLARDNAAALVDMVGRKSALPVLDDPDDQ